MAALNRGIAHYQGGTDDAQPPVAPVAPAAPSGIGQLLSGVGSTLLSALPGVRSAPTDQYAAARDNPASSPLTSTLGQFADYLSRSTRAQQASAGPSLKDWMGNLFTGDQASTAALTQRAEASRVLKDPVVQHNLMNNPDLLTRAEQDPIKFATVAQEPSFRADLEKAAGVSKAAAANPKVTPDEHKATVDKANNTGVHPDVAHQAVAPHKYTREEFVNTFSKVPTDTFMQLFGNQLGHVVSPQEKAASIFFDKMHDTYAEANAKVKKMEEEDTALTKEGKSVKHSGYVVWGKNAYDTAKDERDKAMKATMDALGSFAGITNKGYVVPQQ
jgi:hypothetical protein